MTKKNLAWVTYLVLFINISLVAQKANAFSLTMSSSGTVTTGWAGGSVTFDIDTSCSSYLSIVESAIDSAAKTWGKVPTSKLSIQKGSMVTLPHPITTYVGSSASSYAPVGNTIIYCDSNFGADGGVSANSIPGFAAAQNYSSSGEITGALLVLNVQSGASANVTTLDSTLVGAILTHEIGHCLGFGHSSDTEAIMYYATGVGRQIVLAKDDIDAVTYLYPKQELGNSFLGCSSVTAINSQSGRRGGSMASFLRTIGPDLLLILAFLVLIHLRRRRTGFSSPPILNY